MGSSTNVNINDTDPVWDNGTSTGDVQSLFKTPYFDTSGDPASTGQSWYECMAPDFSIFIFDQPNQPNNMFDNGPGVYSRLASGNMPKGELKFPPDATEMFRIWYNNGGKKNAQDHPTPPQNKIPPLPDARLFKVADHPVWDAQDKNVDDIKSCFTNPCWIKGGNIVAGGWVTAMKHFQFDAFSGTMLDLQNYDHVKAWALTIYNHLASFSMPISEPFFSPEAIQAFKKWYDQGCPNVPSDVGHMPVPSTPAPIPPVKKPFQTRKDINTLSASELQAYRTAVLKLNSNSLTSSTWQTGGYLHAHWCLHYMQASFPWHRAHLMWLEAELGVPIPYWNFFSSQADQPASADSGLPKAFLDDTFIDISGTVQPNPLRHALAREGKSRASTGNTVLKEVQRASQLTDPTNRDAYITQWVPQYLKLIYDATQIPTLTTTAKQQNQGFTFGTPDLTTWNDVKDYPQATPDFDVVLEQAHDNYHGWSGPDMANNSFAAYDPLFWSFHANFDRIFETWLRTKASSSIAWEHTPLRPFVFDISGTDVATSVQVSIVEDGDPTNTKYTTAADMVQDSSKKLGFTYAPPGNADFVPIASPPHVMGQVLSRATAQGPQSSAEMSEAAADNNSQASSIAALASAGLSRAPFVVFPNTKCTNHTYYLHVGLDKEPDKKLIIGEPGYIGHLTRLGMGPDNGNNRCIQDGIVRMLDGVTAAAEIQLQSTDPLYLKVLVTQDIPDQIENNEVSKDEYRSWEGFSPILLW